MNTAAKWRKLFLFCLGLTLAAAFCMKWMESDLWQGKEKFTILGLEWFYPREKVAAILSSLTPTVKTVLRYHLTFDFAFMAGIYPAIASICMIAAEKSNQRFRQVLFVLAVIQTLAWLGDIGENYYLIKWLEQPVQATEWSFYHFLVAAKWLIALAGFFIGLTAWITERRKSM